MSVLRMIRGDDRTFVISITDAAGAPLPLTSVTLRWTARRSYGGPTVIEKMTGDGIENAATVGDAALIIDAADTVDLPDAVTDLLWDVEADDATVQTPISGVLRIYPDVTTPGGS